MDGGVGAIRPDRADQWKFDSRDFRLNEEDCPSGYGFQHLFEGRNADSVGELVGDNLVCPHLRDPSSFLQVRIVMKNDVAVGGGVDVDLDALRAELDGAE